MHVLVQVGTREEDPLVVPPSGYVVNTGISCVVDAASEKWGHEATTQKSL